MFMERPEFDNIEDYDEFSKYYWYRDELIKYSEMKEFFPENAVEYFVSYSANHHTPQYLVV